jgi:hypothetical protein
VPQLVVVDQYLVHVVVDEGLHHFPVRERIAL